MTGFTLAYAVMRVCGGQPRKNLDAPGYLEKVPRGNQTQKVKEMIDNIDLVFLNAKNS